MAPKLELTIRSPVDVPANVSRIKKGISRAELVCLEIVEAFETERGLRIREAIPMSAQEQIEAWESLFEEFAHLNTRKLILRGRIPIAGLTKMLQLQGPTLTTIEFHHTFRRTKFVGTRAHVQKFKQVLTEQSHLKMVYMNYIGYECPEDWKEPSYYFEAEGYQEIVRAFCDMPSLQSLDLALGVGDRFQTLTQVSNSSKLQHLEVNIGDGWSVKNQTIISIKNWIASLKTKPNCALVSLTLKGYKEIWDDNARDFVTVETSFFQNEVADFLTNSQTLEELELPLFSLNSLQPLIVTLKTNRTLRSLCIKTCRSNGQPSESLNSEIIAMLKENQVLLRFVAKGWKKPQEVQDLLLLNKAGRAMLSTQEHTPDYWVNALATCCGNITGLYFYLRHNPALLFRDDNKIPNLRTVRNPIKPKKPKRKRKY